MQDNSALGRALAMVRDLRDALPLGPGADPGDAAPLSGRGGAGARPGARRRRADAIRGELSDLLLHLAFQLVIAEERGEFTAGRRRRRARAEDAAAPSAPLRPGRRPSRGSASSGEERRGRTLAGLVPTLPPLLKAYRLQERAASVGFDWPDVEGPLRQGAGGAGGGGGRSSGSVPTHAAAGAPADPNTPGRRRATDSSTRSATCSSRW